MDADLVELAQRGVLGSRSVEQREQARDADRIGVLPAAGAELVLLVVVGLLVGAARLVLHEFVAGVDAPRGRTQRGEHRADREDRGATVPHLRGEDVVRRGPEGRAHEVRRLFGDLTQVLFDFLLGGPPREVRVGLVEANRAEGAHHGGAREGLGQEERARVLRLDVGEQTLPEGDGLRVRVVDAEDRHAVVDPQLDDVAHGLVDALRVVVEVQGVDVLVLLRRVLRVSDGAVGARREPLGMLLDPRMVGGALEGQVESDLQAEASGALDEAVEVGKVAELGMDGVVATLGGADAVGRTRVAGGGLQGVVLALAVRRADRVDRGQVDDVEAHARDAREVLRSARERAGDPCAVGALEGTRRAREDLVPCTRQGLRAGHVERVHAGGIQQVAQRVVAEDQAHARGDASGEALLGGMTGVAQAARRVGQDVDVRGRGTLLGGVAVGGAFGRALHEEGALFEHELDVDARADLYGRVVAPRRVGVGPGVDAEGPGAGGVGGDPGLVAVQAGGNVHHARA